MRWNDRSKAQSSLPNSPLFSTSASYLAYNLARKALAVAAPGLQQGPNEGGLRLSKTDLGLVSSSFTAMYGASKFAGSVITGEHNELATTLALCYVTHTRGRETLAFDDQPHTCSVDTAERPPPLTLQTHTYPAQTTSRAARSSPWAWC